MTVERLTLFLLATAGLFLNQGLYAQTLEYDDAGRLVEIRFPDGKGVSYTHDDAGNLTTVLPLTLPPAPSNFQIAAADSFQQALTWTDNSDAETAFRVERRIAGRYTWETLEDLPPGSTSYTDSLPSYENEYRYRISALAGDELQSAFSNEAGMIRQAEAYLPQAKSLGESWVLDPVFGLLYTAQFPWVYSPDQGWWYLSGNGRDSLYIYDLSLGWLWTGDSLYPYFYSFSLQNYIYYASSTESLRYFYNYHESVYVEFPKSGIE